MDLRLNAERFTGAEYVQTYDWYRPAPPVEILHQALNYANTERAKCVVDLGCGTGLSSCPWSSFADRVIGVEPSEEMIGHARQKLKDYPNLHFESGYGHAIPLPDHSADILTSSQAFHWMEPQSTLKEVNRVLRPGSVFLLYDVIWPPAVNGALEAAYQKLFRQVEERIAELKEPIAFRWDKKEHIHQVQNSGYFKLVKEVYYHKTEAFDKERFIGIAMSQGSLEALRKRGYSADTIGITEFIEQVRAAQLPVYSEMTYHYRVIFAIK
jgi:ubiquinone/menaquinone biosynthesis C-methylase UbiE